MEKEKARISDRGKQELASSHSFPPTGTAPGTGALPTIHARQIELGAPLIRLSPTVLCHGRQGRKKRSAVSSCWEKRKKANPVETLWGVHPSSRMSVAFAFACCSARPSCVCGNQSKSRSLHSAPLQMPAKEQTNVRVTFIGHQTRRRAPPRSWEANLMCLGNSLYF